MSPRIESSQLMDRSVKQDELINAPCPTLQTYRESPESNRVISHTKGKCRLPVAMTTAAAV